MSVSITDRNFGKLLDSPHKISQSTFVPVRLFARLVDGTGGTGGTGGRWSSQKVLLSSIY